MANRSGRVKALIGKNISDILAFELKNPHIGMVSVNEVVVNSDYSLAKVYVSFLGSKYPLQNLDELNRCKGVVRSFLAKKMDLWKVPDIVFIYDERFNRAESLEKALAKEEDDINKAKKAD
ncbi:MAG: 30S ribosome-binding factor RbfA [Bacilli bacterium]|jgi:ribosome-binding factor A|nr:30S ribosome-binding factor RbfA [Bacilli bacterium]MCI2054783.1 30S ribosome-binding factor RbfA [Bacilli bacterium]